MTARNSFEALVDHWVGFGAGIPVVSTTMIKPGALVVVGGAVHAHPLDVIALRCGDDMARRLHEAIAWIVERHARRFAALLASLDEQEWA